MSTARERMFRGEEYDSRDPVLLAAAGRARALLANFTGTSSDEVDLRHAILVQLLGGIGPGVWVEPPFFCDYGAQVFIGARSFVNANCVFLDAAEIRIGANTLIGPAVQLLTVGHPVRATDRIIPEGERADGAAPYRTWARPIVIGENAWIGAGSIVLPGVTIGSNTTIGAGSIVTGDIPDGVLAFGQPCRVQRTL